MHKAVLQCSACSLEQHTGRAAKQDALLQSLLALTAFRLPAIPQVSELHNCACVKLELRHSQGGTKGTSNYLKLLTILASM